MSTKKQKSRKGSKAWRKNIDMTDIEESIETRIIQEMEGGPIDVRANADLFTIDKQGKQNLKTRIKKPLKIDQILNERSAVPSVHGRIRATSSTVVSKVVGSKEFKISKDELKQIKKTANDLHHRGLVKSTSTSPAIQANFDIWSSTPDTFDDTQRSIGKGINGDIMMDFIEEFKFKPPKPPSTLRNKPPVTIGVPAVEIAHPGASYNPDKQEHEKMLQIACNLEIKRLKDGDDLKKLCPVDTSLLISAHGKSADLSMDVQDLLSEDEDVQDVGDTGKVKITCENNVDEDEVGEDELRKTGMTRRKTKVERNKEKRMKEEKDKLEKELHEKKLLNELGRLRDIEKDIEEKKLKDRMMEEERKEKAQIKAKNVPAKLSKHSYKPLFPAVKLSDEIPGSLRELKPEGNLFKERYNNLEKRNIIETRVPVGKRKRYQDKEYEKHSYKRFK